jgi:hypothetical protein
MKVIGQVMLWGGFLSGSLATVYYSSKKGVEYVKELTPEYATEHGFELPDLSAVVIPEEGWHLIPWAWYLASVGVCVAGIVMLRIGKSTDGQKSEKTEANLLEMQNSLGRLIDNAAQLRTQTETLAPSQITKRIDDVMADDFRMFADGRNSITAEYGLDVFADVMTQFAAGERAINRAWSASADGYVDEAATCIERGQQMLQEAKTLLMAAKDT